MDLLYVHLKDLDNGEIRVLEQVVQIVVGAEGGPLEIQGDSAAIGDMITSYV